MMKQEIQDCLAGKGGSYIRPLLWYAGEDVKLLEREIKAISDAGIREFILENRGGDWFCTEHWWKVMECALKTAEELGMRVWMLDDSHVNTGSANDSLAREENARFRPVNLRVEVADFVGPLTAGALMLPRHTALEKVVAVSAFRRDEETGQAIGDPIVLTDKLADDLCLVDLPSGIWRVYFVLTADPSLTGLFANYITMLSRESCRHLIDEVHEKVYAHFARYFGNTFAGFFSDEPAFGNCDGQYGYDSCDHRMGQLRRLYPWWHDMPERLASHAGMTEEQVMAWLPALWDEVQNMSPRLRIAYMEVITALWRDNFSRQIGDWCDAHGVQYIGHVLEDRGAHLHTGWGCGHFFRSMAGQHEAGIDIVLNQLVPGIRTISHASNSSAKEYGSGFYQYTLPKLGASLAHLHPRMANRAVCEVFGAYGWTCGVSVMRAILNHFLANGTNRFIPHAYSLNLPGAETGAGGGICPPGYVKTRMPPTFYLGGQNPQYRLFGLLMQYVQRLCHLLSSGVHQADVAVFYSAEPDWAGCPQRSLDEVAATLVRSGFDFDFLPSDTLCSEACEVADGQLLVNGEHYRALVMPMAELLPERLLRRLDELAAAGLPVLFTDALPCACESADVDILPLISRFSVVPLEKTSAWLEERCGRHLQADPVTPGLRHYCLRKADGTECVLLFNDGNETLEAWVTSPCEGNALLYDAWENRLYRPQMDGRRLRLQLYPQQLLVACCGNGMETEAPLFPYQPLVWHELRLRYDIYMREAGQKEFRLLRADSEPVNLLAEEKLTRCCAEFRYDAAFELDAETARSPRMEIDQCGDGAELWLNGEYCGAAIGPVCRFSLDGRLRAGQNTISIVTADSPAYFDRDISANLLFGTKLPLLMHGFCGPVRIG
ncbi:MAG: hypothetical protein IJJ33_17260 [Victivallales bacterium]|nr:hypothetical protein [Victivallales bacterium]